MNYLLDTTGLSNREFRVGDTIYGKINEQRYGEGTIVYCFDKYANPDIEGPYGKLKSIEGRVDFTIPELVKDKFNYNKRAAFIVNYVGKDKVELEFSHIEFDLKEKTHDFMYDNIKTYKDLLYIEQGNLITIVGFANNNKTINIPSSINGKNVIAIGNYNEEGYECPLINHSNKDRYLVIDEGIKFIYDNAFMGQPIKSVLFPNSLQYLGKTSFYGSKIQDVNLSKTQIDTIEAGTFAMSEVVEVRLPKQMSQIKNMAFCNCPIEKLYMPEVVNEIGNNILHGSVSCEMIGKCEVGIVNLNDIDVMMNFENLTIESLAITDFESFKLKPIGIIRVSDIENNKFAKAVGEYEEISVDKYIFIMEDESKNKFELVIKNYEQSDYDFEPLSLVNYQDSVECRLYSVDTYNIERYLESVSLEEALKGFILCKDSEYKAIQIRKNELEKIAGITINESYSFLFDDFIKTINKGDEFTPSMILKKYILTGKTPDVVNESEEYVKLATELKKYKTFKTSGKNLVEEIKQER